MMIALFLLIGVISGFLSGLLGIGGGLITTPCLLYLLNFVDIQNEHLMQFALGTSIASISINTFISMISHHKLNNLLNKPLPVLIISSACGALFGSYLADFFPSRALRDIFGFFEIFIALIFLFQASNERGEEHKLPKGLKLFGLGFLVSFIASILGIGGGVIMIPIMTYYFVPLKKAIGTASITSFVTALIGSLTYILAGLNECSNQECLGFVYIPAFLFISLGGIISAPIGSQMAKKLPIVVLRKLFSFLIGIMGIIILLSR